MQLIIIDALEKKLVSLTQAGKITVIIPVAVRETSVSRHHGGPVDDPA